MKYLLTTVLFSGAVAVEDAHKARKVNDALVNKKMYVFLFLFNCFSIFAQQWCDCDKNNYKLNSHLVFKRKKSYWRRENENLFQILGVGSEF